MQHGYYGKRDSRYIIFAGVYADERFSTGKNAAAVARFFINFAPLFIKIPDRVSKFLGMRVTLK